MANSIQKNNEAEESIVTYNKNCQTQHTIRHRAPNILPTFENSADDLDNLDDVYDYYIVSLYMYSFFIFYVYSYSSTLVIQVPNVWKTWKYY